MTATLYSIGKQNSGIHNNNEIDGVIRLRNMKVERRRTKSWFLGHLFFVILRDGGGAFYWVRGFNI